MRWVIVDENGKIIDRKNPGTKAILTNTFSCVHCGNIYDTNELYTKQLDFKRPRFMTEVLRYKIMS